MSADPGTGAGAPSCEPPPGPAQVVSAYLAQNSELPSRQVGEGQWILVLSGEIRHSIPVAIELGTRSCALTSFLLRGPAGPAAADLHRVLLRKNRDLLHVRLCLDGDDDVLLVARIPLRDLSEATLDAALGEMLTVGESGFEALVHLGYPGVFPPLRRTFDSASDQAGTPVR